MGGDNAPSEIIKGAIDAVGREKNLKVFLVGQEHFTKFGALIFQLALLLSLLALEDLFFGQIDMVYTSLKFLNTSRITDILGSRLVITASCDRCLKDVDVQIDVEFDKVCYLKGKNENDFESDN